MSSYKLVSYRITGKSPMILHNGQTADPLNEFAKRLKKISGKRKKTDEDHAAMSDIEYDAGLYVSDSFPGTGLYMPSENIYAGLLKAAKRLKLGPYISAAVPDDAIGYHIETPYKNLADMKADPNTWFRKIVTVSTAKVVRTRPVLRQWALTVRIELDTQILSYDSFLDIAHISGYSIGLGDWRPGSPKSPGPYGKFRVSDFEVSDLEM